jgi:hypothetical protein
MRRLAVFALGLWLAFLFSAAANAATGAVAKEPFPSGTLLFLENCNSVVQWSTGGQIAHVAILLNEGPRSLVYEATPGKVRKLSLDEYYIELARLNECRKEDEQIRLHALRPAPEFSAEEINRLHEFLDSQLGRRYSIKNYLRGKPYDGIHCAELTATVLNQTGRYDFHDCHTIHPQALYTSVLKKSAAPQIIALPKLVEKESWCVRAQRRWLAWSAWCRWSSREAWLFLW